MHQSACAAGAPATTRIRSASRTLAALSTLGSSTASAPEVAAILKSSLPQGVSSPFTRRIVSRGA
jgi:hypothetical protein